MIEHIHQLRGHPHADAMVDATALVSLYAGPFGFAAYYDAAQKRMLNGTSPLLRTERDLIEVIRQAQASGGRHLQPMPGHPQVPFMSRPELGTQLQAPPRSPTEARSGEA